MTCDPSEHDFVNESSYSIELETDSAVVETLEEEKKCRHCGKTPDELDDFVTDEAKTTEEPSEDDTSDGAVEAEDGAIIMTNDNSERQSGRSTSSSQSDSSSQQQNRTPPSEESVDEVTKGEQTDDAYIIGGSSVGETEDEETPEVDEGLEEQWGGSDGEVYTGPILSCPNCEYEVPQTSAPQYPGDSCPDCHKAYLQKE